MISKRHIVPEMIDDPAVDERELAESLRFIRMVNHRLGGARAAIEHFKCWAMSWPRGRQIRIIDIGTGSADIPLAIVNWARSAGHRVHITAVDMHETTLELARQHVGDCSEIEIVPGDALKLMDQFEPGSFDYAHAGMFLHHLPDIEVMTVLRIMDRLAGRALIWNDLVRSATARLCVRVLTMPLLGVPAMVRHDARVSVQAGFTREEALDLARRVGLEGIRFRSLLRYRFTLTSEKAAAEAC